MESRYALREAQGAIGHDCRRLEDGRRADFKHTWLHKRIRRDLFERADVIMALQASFLSVSGLGSHAFTDISKTVEIASSSRVSMVKAIFPYLKLDEPRHVSEEEDYDALFDELERIKARRKKREGQADKNTSVGQGEGK